MRLPKPVQALIGLGLLAPANSIPLGVMRFDLFNGRLAVSHVAGIVHLASS